MKANQHWSLRHALALAACAGLISIVGSIILGALSARIPVIADSRYAFNQAFGLTLPIRLVNDAPRYGASFLAAFWTLIAIFAFCSRGLERISWPDDRRSIAFVVACQAIVSIAFSFFSVMVSSDAYAYVLWGRLYGLYAINPYAIGHLTNVQHDPILQQLVAYFGNPPPNVDYGPLWVLGAGLLARVESATSLAVQVWSHRFVAVTAALVTTLALCRILRANGPAVISQRIATFAFHPLVLFETAVGGHNDMVMIAAAAWSFALVDSYPIVAGLLLGASISIKYVAVLIAPFLLIRALKSGAAAATIAGAAAIAAIALFFRPFWISWTIFEGLVMHAAEVTMSTAWVVILAIERVPSSAADHAVVKDAVEITILACLLIVLAWSYQRYVIAAHAKYIWLTITATLWSLPALNPWYLLWLSPALSSGSRWRGYAWWFGLAAFLHYAVDVPRPPTTPDGFSRWIFLLALLTVLMLLLPIVATYVSSRETAVKKS